MGPSGLPFRVDDNRLPGRASDAAAAAAAVGPVAAAFSLQRSVTRGPRTEKHSTPSKPKPRDHSGPGGGHAAPLSPRAPGARPSPPLRVPATQSYHFWPLPGCSE